MIVQCPHCGQEVEVKGIGRHPLSIPLTNVCDALKRRSSVALAAEDLKCSQPYIFKVLKANGLKLKDVIGVKSNV